MENERRKAPRHPFVATAEVEEISVGSRLPTRVSDLSVGGCYVDTVNPFPGGTEVRVKIFTMTEKFEAPATVAYAVQNLGMGLNFRAVASEDEAVLRGWLRS
jgi:hypothetical protein